MAVNPDLAATVLDVTGAKPTRSIDGRSIIPYAKKPSRRTRRPVLHEIFRQGAGGDLEQDGTQPVRPRRRAQVPSYRAVRTTRWIWVEYSDGSRELYDLARDPQQLRSRHADRRYRRTRAALRKELKRLAKCKGKSCRRQAARIPGPTRR